MRTTVNLDTDIYDFASAYEAAKGLTLSAALSQLVRRAEKNPAPDDGVSRLKRSPHGYLIIAGTGNPLTPEMVKAASQDLI